MTRFRVHFDTSKISSVQSEIDNLLEHESVDSAYLAGSFSSGLETPTSDIDLYILTSGTPTEDLHMKQILTEGERIDIETYSLDEAQSFMNQTLGWNARVDDLSGLKQNDDDVDFVIRMLYGTVLKSSPALDSMRAELSNNVDVLRQLLIARWSLEANAHYEDFRGVLSQREYTSAALIAGYMFTAAGKAYAAGTGDLYFGRKWVARQVERTAGSALPLDEFMTFLLGSWSLASNPESSVPRLVSLLQSLLLAAQTLGWDTPDASTARYFDYSEPLKHQSYLPLRLTDGVLLNNERVRQLLVSSDVARVWAESDAAYASYGTDHPIDQGRRSKIRAGLETSALFA